MKKDPEGEAPSPSCLSDLTPQQPSAHLSRRPFHTAQPSLPTARSILLIGLCVRVETPALQDPPGMFGVVGEFEQFQIGLIGHALLDQRLEIDPRPPITPPAQPHW